MFTFKASFITTAAALLLTTGSAWAAASSPAAGMHPLFQHTQFTSQVDRNTVEAEVAGHLPAVGQMSAQSALSVDRSMLTRAQVRGATAAAAAASGEFPVAVGQMS